jgi:hypothetical protein
VKDARDVPCERDRAGQCRAVRPGMLGTLAAGGGAAWPASSCATAHRRGPLPAATMPRTPPQQTPRRNAPWVTRSASLAGPVGTRHVRQPPDECHKHRGRNAAHCPGWPLQPQRCFASRCAGRACGAPLTLETSASPAGLTARARPKARPYWRAANLRSPIRHAHRKGGVIHRGPSVQPISRCCN